MVKLNQEIQVSRAQLVTTKVSYGLNWKLSILAANYFNVLVKVVNIGGYNLISQLSTHGKLLVKGWMVHIFNLSGFVLM
jgi:hypothetical protein